MKLITLKSTVKSLLEATGAAVWYFYPRSWMSLPAVSWRESKNREFAQADGCEHLAELEYTVDVWAKGPEEMHALADEIDELLTALRLRRDFAQDLFESGVHHWSMRYRCVADAEGRIYQ